MKFIVFHSSTVNRQGAPGANNSLYRVTTFPEVFGPAIVMIGKYCRLLSKGEYLKARGQQLCVQIGRLGFLVWGPEALGN